MIVATFVLLYVACMIPVGLYASRKVKNSEDYVLAGRSLPFYMALATVFATWFGSESIIGASSKFAEGGFSNVLEDPFGAALCLIIAGIFFNRKLYALNFLTIGDYFKHRYNATIAMFLSLIIIMSYFGWVGAQFLALGLVLSTIIPGLSLLWAVLFSATIVLVYTFFGGMYSVAWLDTIQTVVVIFGLGAVLIYALQKIGGLDVLISTTPPDYWRILPQNKDSLTSWIVFVSAIMTFAFGSIPQQDVYQRAMSAVSAKVSMWASIIAGMLYFFMVMIPILIALVARHLYPQILATDPQQLILTLVQDHTPITIQVLFFGALVSAIISTSSGALLAPGTLLAENIVKPFFANMSDSFRLHSIRIAVIVVAIVGAVMALSPDAHIYELVSEAYSITLVAAFVPLAFGLYSAKVNSFGALLSILFGITAWQIAGNIEVSPIPDVFFGFVASVVGMIFGSMLGVFIQKEEKVI